MNILNKVLTYWFFPGAEKGWSCDVHFKQDNNYRNDEIVILDVYNCDIKNGDEAILGFFKNSIYRAVMKASPFSISPYEDEFEGEIIFRFIANK